MKRSKNRVIVGMSGGLDSSVAAALLVEQGYEVIGITIKTYNYEEVGGNIINDSNCCSIEGINDARRVCLQLGIPHYVVDFTEVFRENIIDFFVEQYVSGKTPNPCVRCNRMIKWGQLLKKADALGAEYVAMGHYARIQTFGSRYYITRGADPGKDQSYALWTLTQEQLARTLFPLGDYTKTEVRKLAEHFGLSVARKGESFDLCFIPDNNYHRFLKEKNPDLKKLENGKIIFNGKVIGRHRGYPFYTIGQRRGLGISHSEPLYVLNVIPEENLIEVGTREQLYHRGLVASNINLLKYESLQEPIRVTAKIRYKDPGAEATAWVEDDLLYVEFVEPRPAITPGQSVVLYEGEDLIAGGIIQRWYDPVTDEKDSTTVRAL